MPFKYWRTMVCALALGACGLAVWADDSLRGSKKDQPAPNKSTPPQPALPKAIDQPKIDLPVAPAPPSLPNDPPPLPRSKLELPPDPPPPAPKLELPRITPAAATPPATPPAPAIAPVEPSPARTVPITPLTQPAASQFKMLLRMGGNSQPRFEIKDGDALLLKVSCERIELQSQRGLTASGQVHFRGSGLEGTCEQLAVCGSTREVELKGNVILNCYRGGASSQVSADQVKFELKGAGDAAFKASGVSKIAR